jgi:hypothetical protein
MWIRATAAFQPVVEWELFQAARDIFIRRFQRTSDAEMLSMLSAVYEKEGRLSGLIINECKSIPSTATYRKRFGSLLRAYRLVGYTPARDMEYIEINRYLRRKHSDVVEEVLSSIESLGGEVEREEQTDLLTINREFSTSVVVARCRRKGDDRFQWHVRLDVGLAPDITVAVRMDDTNQNPLDYYLLPQIDMPHMKIRRNGLRMGFDNELMLDIYRFNDLGFFFGMAERIPIGVPA